MLPHMPEQDNKKRAVPGLGLAHNLPIEFNSIGALPSAIS